MTLLAMLAMLDATNHSCRWLELVAVVVMVVVVALSLESSQQAVLGQHL